MQFPTTLENACRLYIMPEGLGLLCSTKPHGNFHPPVQLSSFVCGIVCNRVEFTIPQGHDPIPIDTVIVHQVVLETSGPLFGQGQVVLLITDTVGKSGSNHKGIWIFLQVIPQHGQLIDIFTADGRAVEIEQHVVGLKADHLDGGNQSFIGGGFDREQRAGQVDRIVHKDFHRDHPRTCVDCGHRIQKLFFDIIGCTADQVKADIVILGKFLGDLKGAFGSAHAGGFPVREHDHRSFPGKTGKSFA